MNDDMSSNSAQNHCVKDGDPSTIVGANCDRIMVEMKAVQAIGTLAYQCILEKCTNAAVWALLDCARSGDVRNTPNWLSQRLVCDPTACVEDITAAVNEEWIKKENGLNKSYLLNSTTKNKQFNGTIQQRESITIRWNSGNAFRRRNIYSTKSILCTMLKLNEKWFLPVVRRAELTRGALARVVVLNLNRAGTTLAAESLASNVITHAATIIKPIEWFLFRSFQFFIVLIEKISNMWMIGCTKQKQRRAQSKSNYWWSLLCHLNAMQS